MNLLRTKYRIVTNGKAWRAQRRTCLGWFDLDRFADEADPCMPWLFDCKDEACRILQTARERDARVTGPWREVRP